MIKNTYGIRTKDACFVCGKKFEEGQEIYHLTRYKYWIGSVCSNECYLDWKKEMEKLKRISNIIPPGED